MTAEWPGESPLLSARISVDYREKPGVLRDVSLNIHEGEIVGLIGESGSGKSTLALALLQLLQLKGAAVRGEIVFRGKNLLEQTERRLRAIRGKEISVVLQSPLTSLNPALRIGTQLREAWRAHSGGSNEKCVAAMRSALKSVCLPQDPEFLKRRPSQLSVGQAQRVIIAMAVLHKPALLIADEATSALDTITQSEILKLLSDLNRELNMAVLFISHDLLSVASLCHRIAILRDGRIVECGTPDMIFHLPQNEYTRKLIAALPNRPGATGPRESLHRLTEDFGTVGLRRD